MISASVLLNLVLVSALSVPSPVRKIRDNVSTILVLSSKPASLTLPSPIPGFEAKVTLGKTSTLPADETLFNAFQLMLFLSIKRWEDYIHVPFILAMAEGEEEIVISPLAQSTSRPQIKHAVWGLYDASVAVSRRLFDRLGLLPKVYTGLFLHGRLIGFLKMQDKSPSSDSVTANNTLRLVGSYGDLNTTSDVTQVSDLHRTISARSETITDTEDSKFKIRYTPDTDTIEPADMFTAFMDGLATAAEFDYAVTGAFINAVAESGACAINVHGTGLHSQLSWALLIQTLSVIFSLIVWAGKKVEWIGL